jgi:hypothetical protein
VNFNVGVNVADEHVFSPDGQFMWTGRDWIPAPPSTKTLDSQPSHGTREGSVVVQPPTLNNQDDVPDIDFELQRLYDFVKFARLFITKRDKAEFINKIILYTLVGMFLTLFGFGFAVVAYQENSQIQMIMFSLLGISGLGMLVAVQSEKKLFREYITQETGYDYHYVPDASYPRTAIKLQREEFTEIAAIFNYLLSLSENTHNWELRSKLTSISPELELVQKKFNRQDINKTIVTSAVAGAVAYGVARKLTDNK